MKEELFQINDTPTLLLGEQTDRLYLFIHGQQGNKFEARAFAELACPRGWQVLAIDLPEHGQRQDGKKLLPWDVLPELQAVLAFAGRNWSRLALRANSIGAWFSMLAFPPEQIEQYLFVSPILDMVRLIETMMGWAAVTEEQLQRAGEIATDFGQTLSWPYLCFAREHQPRVGYGRTAILYGEQDELTPQVVLEQFARENGCESRVMAGGEHWFHTPEQLAFLDAWEEEHILA